MNRYYFSLEDEKGNDFGAFIPDASTPATGGPSQQPTRG